MNRFGTVATAKAGGRSLCRSTSRLPSYWMAAVIAVALTGCAAYQDVVVLDFRAVPSGMVMVSNNRLQGLSVAVAPFPDRRVHASGIGHYTRFWGKQVPFAIETGDLGEVVALDTIDYLKTKKGWHTWIDKPDVVVPAEGTHLRLSGNIVEWMTEASDWGFFTSVQTKLTLDIEIRDLKSDRVLPIHLVKDHAFWMMGFDARRLGEEVSELFHQGLDEVVERTRTFLPAARSDIAR